ncbi:MAG: flagellar hook-basal body complex protein, partial [Campylobacter sp.]|nr:flagellar hook-basal body complex protein [Campylobacter sp.]
YATSEDGTILAVFDNGMQAAVARVPLFHFQNDQGLFSEGGVYFSPTANSGEAFMYAKEDGRLYNGSVIKNYMLENSNVDLNREMTMLIVQQRAYEASAKSISTSDQMLQRAINMKNG